MIETLDKLLSEEKIDLAKVNKLLSDEGYGYRLIKKKFKSLQRLINWRNNNDVKVKLVQTEGKDVVCYYHQQNY